uniref:ShKT domain-containing protein n=1 Tax=Ditylenchus dipsaci TaxID=166011 RepID=A0A915D915_9BILA
MDYPGSNGASRVYYDNVEQQQCLDQRNDCFLFLNICDHPSYEWYMKCYCRRTCNRCSDYMTNKANGNIAVTVNNNWMGGPGQWRDENKWDRNRVNTSSQNSGPDKSNADPSLLDSSAGSQGSGPSKTSSRISDTSSGTKNSGSSATQDSSNSGSVSEESSEEDDSSCEDGRPDCKQFKKGSTNLCKAPHFTRYMECCCLKTCFNCKKKLSGTKFGKNDFKLAPYSGELDKGGSFFTRIFW